MKRYYLAAAALLALFVVACCIERADSLPLPRHDITGFAARVACTPDAGLDWTFTSSNASGHHIVKAQFDRRVDLISQTADTVVVHSAEKPGPTSLTITVTWEDGHVSRFTASTIMLDGVCPPPPTTTTTTHPPFPTLPPLPTVPPQATTVVPPSSVPPPASTAGTTTTVPGSTAPPGGPSTTARIFLPPTGSGDWLLLLGAVGLFAVLAGLVLATAKRNHEGER